MKTNKEQMIFARVDAALHARLEKASGLLDRPASQIIREALRRELDRLEAGRPRKTGK